jgi:hypothetical protein
MRGVMFADLGIPNIQIRKICRTYGTWVVFDDVPSPYAGLRSAALLALLGMKSVGAQETTKSHLSCTVSGILGPFCQPSARSLPPHRSYPIVTEVIENK